MTNDERRKPTRFAATLICAALAPILYLLSFGPAWVALSYDCVSHEIFGVIYLPVFWLARRSVLFDDFIGWYMDASINVAQLVLPPSVH